MPLTRRALLLTAPLLLTAQAARAAPATLTHRGYTVDTTLAASMPNRAAIETSLKKQIDIVVDCGAKPEIMKFFHGLSLKLKTDRKGGPGRYSAAGVEIQAEPQPEDNPILLHEMLHGVHARYLPNGHENADVKRFFDNATRGKLYPANEYVMSNDREFFAVTGSLYLWGKVARPPNNRETLRSKQPQYYAWLGDTFGVKK